MTLKEIKWKIFWYGCTAKITNKSKVCQDMIRLSIEMSMNGGY